MNRNLLGIFASLLYILLVLGMATMLHRTRKLQGEGARKLIHVGVSGWWVIAMIFFTRPLAAAAVPLLFVVVNSLSLRFNILKAMERPPGENSLGTVYYALSLTVLALVCFGGMVPPLVGALGIFAMAFGDGFAAVLGKRHGKKKYTVWGKSKSYVGSVAMFLLCFTTSLILLYIFAPQYALATALLLALGATVLEALSPFGLDNITVPLGTSALYWFFYSAAGPFATFHYVATGLLLSGAMALYTQKRGMLTCGGAVAAFAVATGFYALGRAPMWVLLMLFFLSSSLIGKIKKRAVGKEVQQVSRKEGPRDCVQVLANSAPALVCLVLYNAFGQNTFLLLAVCAVAASAADTWASEIGTLSKKQPRSILGGKPVPRGLSGGVSLLGFAASLGGAALIAAAGALMYLGRFTPGQLASGFAVVLAAGFAGSVIDSLLGALVQAKYQCVVCHRYTEKLCHHQKRSRLVGGFAWINNDMINFLSGALTAAVVFVVL